MFIAYFPATTQSNESVANCKTRQCRIKSPKSQVKVLHPYHPYQRSNLVAKTPGCIINRTGPPPTHTHTLSQNDFINRGNRLVIYVHVLINWRKRISNLCAPLNNSCASFFEFLTLKFFLQLTSDGLYNKGCAWVTPVQRQRMHKIKTLQQFLPF